MLRLVAPRTKVKNQVPAVDRVSELSSLDVRLVSDIEALEALAEPWRALAHACSCPGALPAWQIAWWRHVIPEDAQLRAVVVFESECLIGLAPFYFGPGRRVDYRLLGADLNHRLTPLALPGREKEIASLVAETLAQARPRPDLVTFEAIDAASPWPDAVRESWPGRFRPWRYTSSRHPGAVIRLEGLNYASWLGSRSKRLRAEIRRSAQEVEQVEGRMLSVVDEAGAKRALEQFAHFHAARWEHSGTAFGADVIAAISEAMLELLPRGEMRISTLDIQGDPVAVWIFLAAGGETTAFRTAYEARWSYLKPGQISLLASIDEAFEKGDRRVDFGAGADNYKLRFANDDDPFMWTGLVPRNARYPLTRLRLAPDQACWTARRLAHHLPPEQRKRIKRFLRRG